LKRLVDYHSYLKNCVNHRMRLSVGESGAALLWKCARYHRRNSISFMAMQPEFTPLTWRTNILACLPIRSSLRNRADDGVYSVLSKDITGRRPRDDEREWHPFFVERLFPGNWDTMRHLTYRYDWGKR